MKSLVTERLVLRGWKESDAEDMYEYAKVDGVGEMAGWPHHQSIDASRGIIRHFIEKGDVYAVVLKEGNKVVGSLGIHDRTMDPEYAADIQREIGYVLSKSYWGMGLMAEAVREAIKYAFDEINADVLWCGHYKFNTQSQRVIEKTGFRFYREEVLAAPLINKTFDGMTYIMTKEDYRGS